jgi:hypothetical protein
MTLPRICITSTTLVLTSLIGWQGSPVRGQQAQPAQTAAPSADQQESQRRQILESDRWQRMGRTLNEWLSIQQVYTAEQVATIRSELSARASQMTPRELEQFMHDMEERLEVLTSAQADEARQWLAHFFATRRNPEAQLRRSRPDVLNMTAGEIRQELQWLQQHRAGRQQTNAAYSQARALQQESAIAIQDARRQAQSQAAQSRSRAAANAQFRSQYAGSPQDRPNFSELRPAPVGTPIYSVSPWGTPIYWHPMHGQW